MRGGIFKVLVAAALAALLALGLPACDDDDGGSSDGETASSSKEGGSQTGGGEPGADFEPAPLRVSGDGAELREAAEAVHAFYVARARDEWSATCSRVAQAQLEKLESLAAQSERKGCTDLLESFSTPMSNEEWREATVMDAESLRVDGKQASLVYQGAGGETYSIPLHEEDGEWKVESLAATSLG
ncbi:MAG TPA: hypothetical protein VNO20_02680 [Solirubrobacterales bacterium]|nr:hypothetical protein [Solirubrobacterales bacterium]